MFDLVERDTDIGMPDELFTVYSPTRLNASACGEVGTDGTMLPGSDSA